MGITFNKIVENSRTVGIDFGEDVLNITYKPAALSPANMKRMQAELNKGDDTDPYAVAEMFCQIVTEWDLIGPLGDVKQGAPVPVAVDYVAELPSSTIGFIMQEVAEDAAPKSKTRSSK